MRVSIWIWMTVAFNALVIGVALVVGLVGAEVAGHVVQQRLIGQVSENAVQLVRRLQVPLSDRLMGHLRSIFGVDFAITTSPAGQLVASTLEAENSDAIASALATAQPGQRIELDGRSWIVQDQPFVRRDRRGQPSGRMRLWLLLDRRQLTEARNRVERRLWGWIWPALLVATCCAVGLSAWIARPLRRLTRQMDEMAGQAEPNPDRLDLPARGPSEVARLATAFSALLARLAAARDDLARSERLAAMGMVAASVAHELRNPLSAIRMNVRLLADELADAGLDSESVQTLAGQIERMDLFLDELVQLARPDAPAEASDARARADLPEAVEAVASLLAGRLRHAGVELDREWLADLPPVRLAPRRLRQMLMNLLLNAIEISRPGQSVRIRARAEGPWIVCQVLDRGPGLPPDKPLFEPFVSGRGGGAGLGLYVCRQILESVGGRIDATDRPDGGACFGLHLPIADLAAEPGNP